VKYGSAFRDITLFQTPGLIGRFVSVLLVCAVAIPVVGYWIGTSQLQWLVLLLATTVATFVITGVRRRAWLLVPFAWGMGGGFGLLPLPFSVRDWAVLLVFATWLVNVAFSRQRLRARWHVLDFVLLANFVWLAFTYYLNPVGLRAASSTTYGGRYYWNFIIAGMAYWVMVRLPESPKQATYFSHAWVIGLLVVGVLNIAVYAFPGLTPYIFALYSGVATELFVAPGAPVRLGALGIVGVGIARYLCAYYPPLTLFNPIRLRTYGLFGGLVCIMLSGFRSALIVLGPIFFFGAYFRRRTIEIVAIGAVGLALLAIAVMGHGNWFRLPYGVQRTISFLPGQWDQEVLDGAQGSAEWRFQLWRDIFRYRMIKNWWLGDGFGVEQQDFELTRLDSSEALILRGSYHNGPLTTIRYTGLAGLVFFYSLMIAGAYYAFQCVKQCRGTILFPAAILVATELIWQPFHYTLVFGSFVTQLPDTIFFIAIVRLLMEMRARISTATPPEDEQTRKTKFPPGRLNASASASA
jgi:hypothetical protein